MSTGVGVSFFQAFGKNETYHAALSTSNISRSAWWRRGRFLHLLLKSQRNLTPINKHLPTSL
jgi:hypothetical protein